MGKMVEVPLGDFVEKQINERIWVMITRATEQVADFVNLDVTIKKIDGRYMYCYGDPEDPLFMLEITVDIKKNGVEEHEEEACDCPLW